MKSVRIVPTSPENGNLALSQGTQVFFGDTELHGIRSITTTIEVDEPVRATMKLYVEQVETNAIATFMTNHPMSGEWKEIKCIVFEDGTVFDPDSMDITTLASTAREKELRHK